MIKVISDTRIPIFVWADKVDDATLEQATNLTELPFLYHHIGLMADAHGGYGMPIGGVIASNGYIIPNAVGKDIGCGVRLITIGIKIKDLTRNQIIAIREDIKRTVPYGVGKHRKDPASTLVFFIDSWQDIITNILPKERLDLAIHNLGTIGSGNHFIEVQEDDNGYLNFMIHTGSRSLGNDLCDYYHKLALSENKKWCSKLPDEDLAFLPIDSKYGVEYIRAMRFACDYALENRNIIESDIIKIVKEHLGQSFGYNSIDVKHNYAELENHYGKNLWIHRKGAVRARKGENVLIPGSQGTASYYCKGLGNEKSFMSCSHGAGRPMSRTAASEKLTKEECDKAMEGVIFDGWKTVKRGRLKGQLDFSESPNAYKNIDEVIKNQSDLVEVISKLKPIASIKG